jgi:carboxymethylenebutenolidase
MIDEDLRRRAIALYDYFTHVDPDRRRFMAALTRLAGSAAAAQVLLAGVAADPAAAALVPEDDPRVVGRMAEWETAPGRTLKGYWVTPKEGAAAHAAVMVIHENRGLQPYTRDIARRLAIVGFNALAPDFLTPSGGSPVGDDDKARAMIAALDLRQTAADAAATVAWLAGAQHSAGKVGVVGFCWGGALADRVAVDGARGLAGVVSFYGPAPDPADAKRVKVPLLLHYAGLDMRVDATAAPWVAALKAAHKPFTSWTYPGVNHAFHNDTAADRYDKAAATLAWDRTIAFFRRTLA